MASCPVEVGHEIPDERGEGDVDDLVGQTADKGRESLGRGMVEGVTSVLFHDRSLDVHVEDLERSA